MSVNSVSTYFLTCECIICCCSLDTTPTILKMEDLLQDTVKNSVQGWDSVLEGLVAFALYLMEGFSPKFPNAPFADLTSVHQQVCSTGAKLLVHTYEVGAVVVDWPCVLCPHDSVYIVST